MKKKMTISENDVELIKKFIAIKNRGHYADSKQLTEVYNRVLGKNVRPTNCGQCLRSRVNELEKALKTYEKELQNANESGFTTIEEAVEEGKKIMEEMKEMEVQNADKPKPHKTKGGKKVQKQTAR